ncbi:hypothetical protein GUITHDRAFT_157281 [Guillardia theta CCMP2712]|uniref:ABC1 atypical kinase-like domain-containing protein n=1 Tax=Guillardia theta (strain CCMP2712) TaxID=905079 RepID=L1JQT3_GUITC|nr:hypothetical protein GUITHDRAFT_157281 [Guillardia theta CCMP2712]EKX50448.1 hypothetical protein GUITHDRAFT_157281 [Guillardia theta CCMP2712]|eukprot:XP_005837428.1 hypothetical protein GUITHDRAFT_157281 [Guillardia theta CCMP2712]
MGRSFKALAIFNEVKSDYENSLLNVSDPIRRAKVLKEVHARGAQKALQLARENGGIYNKAAQFVASLQGGAGKRGIPEEYVRTLSVLTDQAPPKTFEEIDSVIKEEFGKSAEELFLSFDKKPIAAASLAQVHRALLHNGTEVAVKVIYPSLRKEMASDFSVLRTMGVQVKPGGLDLSVLINDFEKALRGELDFESEATNSEKTAHVLAHMPQAKVPRVLWEFTSKSVLTMEFERDLLRLNDEEGILAAGLRLEDVGELVADTFSEMILCHGHVHGDPHAGNIYVRAKGSPPRPELVLLDHGLYHSIDDVSREKLCRF